MDIHNCYTIDFETTDVDPKKCEPVEVAVHSLSTEFSWFIKPNNPIPPETSAIHHITDDDIAKAPSWEICKQGLVEFFTSSPGAPLPILVAHNAEYERTIINDGFPPVLWICTYKCALRIWPEAPGHKNEVLRYWLRLGTNRGRSNNQHPHSALHDCQVTFLILQELLKHATLEQLVEWTEFPAKLPHMPMGKHYKQKWEEIPGPYLEWCINQQGMREDVKYCAREELQRRRGATQRSH